MATIKKADSNLNRATKAAYALNLCTVSVSQIIDYEDPVVLDQEYNAILNNINIQNMPKESEALLAILEKILDVITFFRINKKERELVDKEYQFKAKNEIWNAVPNLGLVLASANPIAMAVSLASQIGIGYMNYRKAKAENSLEYEREMWQLEKTAIEQFNALRRQLFDTAWKLSDTYDYNDNLRLTERQIEEYNKILMDADPLRKYNRLDVIKNNFDAYPPFWYHFGHTAIEVAQDMHNMGEDYQGKEDEYKNYAKEHFNRYDELNNHGLLRDDPIACACALEYIDLLDEKKDKQLIKKLLEKVEKYSGGECDILQLSIFAYKKIGDQEKIKQILTRLINSGYNEKMNSQILSQMYVQEWLNAKKNSIKQAEIRTNYQLLQRSLEDARYLFPFPNNKDSIEIQKESFAQCQLYILREKYYYGLNSFFKKYAVLFNRQIPVWYENKHADSYEDIDVPNDYYEDTADAYRLRMAQARVAFRSQEKTEQFRLMMEASEFWYGILNVFDDMILALREFSFFKDVNSLSTELLKSIKGKQKELTKVVKLVTSDGEAQFTEKDYKALQDGLSFFAFSESFIRNVYDKTAEYLNSVHYPLKENEHDYSFSYAETEIRSFCLKENLGEPEILLTDQRVDKIEKCHSIFCNDLLGGELDAIQEATNLRKAMIKAIKESEIIKQNKKTKTRLLLYPELEFRRYTSSRSIRKGLDKRKPYPSILAILDDKRMSDQDLIFTTTGIIPVANGTLKKEEIPYSKLSSIKVENDKIKIEGINKKNLAHHAAVFLMFGAIGLAVDAAKGDTFQNKEIDGLALFRLFSRLGELSAKTKDSNGKGNELVDILNEIYKDFSIKMPANAEGVTDTNEATDAYQNISNPIKAIRFSVKQKDSTDNAGIFHYYLTNLSSSIVLHEGDELIFNLNGNLASGREVSVKAAYDSSVEMDCAIEEKDIENGYFLLRNDYEAKCNAENEERGIE